jgi:tetratricopeptide (TPR) repeat protein
LNSFTVEFFYGAIAVRKKKLPDQDRVESRRAIVHETDRHETWAWFSGYLLRNRGSAEEAVECARRALAGAPKEAEWQAVHLYTLSLALEEAGRLDDALAAAEEAARTKPHVNQFRTMVTQKSAKISART